MRYAKLLSLVFLSAGLGFVCRDFVTMPSISSSFRHTFDVRDLWYVAYDPIRRMDRNFPDLSELRPAYTSAKNMADLHRANGAARLIVDRVGDVELKLTEYFDYVATNCNDGGRPAPRDVSSIVQKSQAAAEEITDLERLVRASYEKIPGNGTSGNTQGYSLSSDLRIDFEAAVRTLERIRMDARMRSDSINALNLAMSKQASYCKTPEIPPIGAATNQAAAS